MGISNTSPEIPHSCRSPGDFFFAELIPLLVLNREEWKSVS
jgi:hypothetical protein